MTLDADDALVLDDIRTMQKELAGSSQGDLGKWEAICAKHVALLEQHGFSRFKRTVNFEYKQWGVTSPRDANLRARLAWAATRPRAWRAALDSRIDEDARSLLAWPGGEVTPRRLLVYRLYVALTDELARTRDQIGAMTEEEPLVGDPVRVRRSGRLVTQDLAHSAIELNTIASVVDLTRVREVGEIGAGYGRFAWLFRRRFLQARYHIFDIPPALAIAQTYLARTLGTANVAAWRPGGVPWSAPEGVHCQLPDALEHAPDGGFQLIVATSALDELQAGDVARYVSLVDRKLDGHLYIKSRRRGFGTSWRERDVRYPARWRVVLQRRDPAHPDYVEKVFEVRP